MAGDRGIFERFGVLSLWKETGYVLRLFPFCPGLEAEFVLARDAGSEAGGWGPRAEGPEEAKPKVYVVLGVDRSAGALIKAWVRALFFFFFSYCEAWLDCLEDGAL